MYLDYLVDIPESKGKITFRIRSGSNYVYYETARTYDPEKRYTNANRVATGKVSGEGGTKMRPNENFPKYFPDAYIPEEKNGSTRSSCLKAGPYIVINQVIRDLGLNDKLAETFGMRAAGMILDFAAYSIVAEDNAAQYHPDYAYNHPLFTPDMKIHSDATASGFLRSVKEGQRQMFLDAWNDDGNKKEKIYVSCDSTNKNCEAGNISMAGFGAAKDDGRLPVFNYAIGYDLAKSEPLTYGKYPGSINDVSQLQFMIGKVKGYGYRNTGFILDRGYFSRDNLRYMGQNGFGFVIMAKGTKEFISETVRKDRGSFENEWKNQIAEFGAHGKTVHTFVYAGDTKKRYVHIYYNASKAAGERARFEEGLQEMQTFLKKRQDADQESGPAFRKYFHLHYNKESGNPAYGEPSQPAIRDELELCGYFAIITSERMNARDAIGLYKNRDASGKVFRADKSHPGNGSLGAASEEAASNKIFIGFIALIIRCRIYRALKDKAKEMIRKPSYLTVPAAIRELEKIEMTRQLDKIYRMDHAVTKTREEILSAFGIEAGHVKYKINCISEQLKGRQIREER